MDKETQDKIRELQEKGYSTFIIAKELGLRREAVVYCIRKWRESGTLVKTKCTVTRPSTRRLISDYDDILIELYKANKQMDEIAKEVNMNMITVRKRLHVLVMEGKVAKRVRVMPKKEGSERKFVKRKRDNSYTLLDEPIKAYTYVCKGCVYGRAEATAQDHRCRFMDCVGVLRTSLLPEGYNHAPTLKHNDNFCYCNVYEKITKENPRRKSIAEEASIPGMGFKN